MANKRVPPMQMPQEFTDFVDHWKALKGSARAPSLADFLDHPIPACQPWIAIVDIGDDLVLRLFGTALVRHYGADFTGKPTSMVYPPPTHAAMRRFNTAIAATFCGAYAVSSGYTSTGRIADMIAVGLPLLRRGGISSVWLTKVGVALSLGETGVPERSIVSERWIDLGNGMPGGT
jgi:hypothetical protein